MMAKTFFLLLFFLLPGVADCTDLSPIAIYLSWKEDPTSSMVIQWITNDAIHGSTLQYKDENDEQESSWSKCVGTECPFPEDQPYIVHTAFCSKLNPDTLYRFRIDGYTAEHLFKTMPIDLVNPLRFIVGGDINLSNIELFNQTTNQAVAQNPSFIIIGGDLACAASKKRATEKCSKWIDFFSNWYAHAKTEEGRLIPLLVTIGNHEVKGGMGQEVSKAPFFYTLFASPGAQGYLTLRFRSYLSLYLLDAGHTHPPGGEQSSWLAANMAEDKYVTHRFAVYHIPAYPNVRSYRNAASTAIRRHFVPTFDKHNLHIAFEHHEHAYKRTFPLLRGNIDPDGTVYIGDGSWGVLPRSPKTPSHTTYLEKAIAARSFSLVTITKTSRTVSEISFDGTTIDSFSQTTDHIKTLQKLEKERTLLASRTKPSPFVRQSQEISLGFDR